MSSIRAAVLDRLRECAELTVLAPHPERGVGPLVLVTAYLCDDVHLTGGERWWSAWRVAGAGCGCGGAG